MAGKGIKNDKQKAAILGSIAGAQHVRYKKMRNWSYHSKTYHVEYESG